MNTAAIPSGTAATRPIQPTLVPSMGEGFLRRAARSLATALAARRVAEPIDAAVLHERHREAERLREANFRTVAVSRLI